MAQNARANNKNRTLARQRPSGWPVGSFESYNDAQAAVDMLADQDFPVDKLTIVGVDLMEVENVTGRLTWGKVLVSGALSGAWMGLFIGLIVGVFGESLIEPIIWAVSFGISFGIVMVAIPYALARGKRDFTSVSTIVAGRYDILCDPAVAPRARDQIAKMQAQNPTS
ncbi:general stress protein [Corynebacterium caspium]|uniref:general stress protein n=1 Tax=Corynebacterium caspium TaxID=234828 RepID=UPI00036D85B2|nr:general stress protein [Corynebacterium caspium]WKD59500.1 hypothetical protein CCASP_05565 [Corynebacterium caspium DSM 44850]